MSKEWDDELCALGENPFYHVKSHQKWDKMIEEVDAIVQGAFNKMVAKEMQSTAPITHVIEMGDSGSTLALDFVNDAGSDLYGIND